MNDEKHVIDVKLNIRQQKSKSGKRQIDMRKTYENEDKRTMKMKWKSGKQQMDMAISQRQINVEKQVENEK